MHFVQDSIRILANEIRKVRTNATQLNILSLIDSKLISRGDVEVNQIAIFRRWTYIFPTTTYFLSSEEM